LFEGIGESGIEVTLGTKLPSLNPEYRTPDMPAAVLIGTRPVRVPQK